MFKHYKQALTVLLFLVTTFAQAQSPQASIRSNGNAKNNFFTTVSQAALQVKTLKAVLQTPQMMKAKETLKNFKLYSIDENALKQYLAQAPLENNIGKNKLDLQVPMPNGEIETFEVVNSQVLSPEIAKQFPSIKTYNGTGKTNKGLIIHFTVSNSGFNAIVLGSKNDFYIERQTDNKTRVANYISYYVKDIVTPKDFRKTNNSCGDKGHTMLHIEPSMPVRSLLDFQRSSYGKGLYQPKPGVSLRTFRLAMSATGEYTNNFPGATIADKQQAAFEYIVAEVNRMCAVYKTDLGVTFTLVSGTNTILTDTKTLSNGDQSALLAQNQTLLDNVIGSDKYDVGHSHTFDGVGTSGGGLAVSPAICNASSKAEGVSGTGGAPWVQLFFDQTFFHEMGHQFGMSHSYNSNIPVCTTREQKTAAEPGSGATIMSYGFTCGSDDYLQNSTTFGPILHFHTLNIDQALATINANSCYVSTPSSNIAPVITAVTQGTTIPKSTPFSLSATASDENGDNLTYTWDGKNVGLEATPVPGDIDNTAIPPYSRSYEASASGDRVFPILSSILDGTNQAKGDKLPSISTTLTYGLTVRDNNSEVGAIATSDVVLTVDGNAGPFLITNDLTGILQPSSNQTITWNVNNTDGSNGSTVNVPNVKISLSTDGGQTFGTVLLESTPNNGSASVTLPNLTTNSARIKVEAIGNIFFDISNSDFTISSTATAVNTWTGVTSSDWTDVSNWSNNVVPTATDDVVIPGGKNPPAIAGTQAVKNITINSGATVTLTGVLQVNGNIQNDGVVSDAGTVDVVGTTAATISGTGTVNNLTLDNTGGTSIAPEITNKLSVTGLLTVNAALQTNDHLVIVSTATQSGMIKDETGALSGKAYIQHFTSGSFGYHHFSSPVSDGIVNMWGNVAFPMFGDDGVVALGSNRGALQIYNEVDNTTSVLDSSYYNYTVLTNPLTPAQGYTAWLNSLPTLNTFGTPNNGGIGINVTHSAGTNDPKGWNFVGNPYPSPISWTALKALNPDLFSSDAACYIWKTSGGLNGSWSTYDGVAGVNGAGDVINSSLGFFIYVDKSGTLKFDNTVRTYSFNSPEVFGTKTASSNMLRLSIKDAINGTTDEAVAYTSNKARFSKKIPQPTGATNATIAFEVKGSKAAINVLTAIDSKTELPVTVLTPKAGTYTLSLSTKNISLPVYLKDAVTGTYTDLSAATTITTSAKETSGRYSIVFSNLTSFTTNNLTTYPNPAKNVVTVKGSHIASVQVIDNLGRVVRIVSLKDATNPTISVSNLQAGAYHLRVQTTDGKFSNLGIVKE